MLKGNVFYKPILICFLFFINTVGYGQYFKPKNYPQDFFTWPVDAQIGIVANFGELRPNHYHMGLDCRTESRQNMPILAAGDGYIAKVKIEPYGFGRCIYINHPNGITTVYAHLNAFYPELEQYVTAQQYALKSWKVFIDIPANRFKVNKGDFIANSGNTGGSLGPHLHFEIRDTKTDKCFNQLMFGLPITDNNAPSVYKLAVYDRSKSTYNQSPRIYSVVKKNGVYTVPGGKIIVNSPRVSFAITAYDTYTGSTNQNGIFGAAVIDDGQLISKFELDNIGYDETRYLNAHIDYPLKARGGPFVQHTAALPGYQEKIYSNNRNLGAVVLEDNVPHNIEIQVADANLNISKINFDIEKRGEYNFSAPKAMQKLIPNYVNIFESKKLQFYMPENAIYDTVYFNYAELPSADGKSIHQVGNADVPVQTYFPVSIYENFASEDTGKIVMKRYAGGKQDYAKAVYNKGWYTASFRAFGNYQLLVDRIPPRVVSMGLRDGASAAKMQRIVFSVSDNSEEIESFNAYLDGQWLRFTNDKGKSFVYNFDERCGQGEHTLVVNVTDLVGNVTEQTYNFTR
jgi:hypothetical protein